MTTRINCQDITDDLIVKIVENDTAYFDRADKALMDIADSMEIEAADVPSTSASIHYRVREFLKAHVGFWVCMDKKGIEQKRLVNGVDLDPYEEKLPDYRRLLNETKSQLTVDVIKNDAQEREDFVSMGIELHRT